MRSLRKISYVSKILSLYHKIGIQFAKIPIRSLSSTLINNLRTEHTQSRTDRC